MSTIQLIPRDGKGSDGGVGKSGKRRGAGFITQSAEKITKLTLYINVIVQEGDVLNLACTSTARYC